MVGWHHQVNGHEVERAPGDSDGKPGVLQSVGFQRIGHDSVIEQNQSSR